MKFRPNLRNFFYLIGSGFVIQIAGTIYRIWLAREIGPEGLGIMQMVYPVYRLLSGVATLGLPLALTKWVSEYLALHEHVKINSIRNWAVRIILGCSLGIGIILFLFAPVLGKQVFTDTRVTEALLIIAFAIPFSALSAVYRGYFQGFSKMAPTATSEITEQIIEISTTFILITALATIMPISSFAAPVAGLTMGEVACLLTLLFFLRKAPKTGSASPADEFSQDSFLPYRHIFRYAWPLLLNQIVLSVSMASEGIIIPRFLISGGLSGAASTGLFGQLAGMAEPVAYFPLIFLAPLGPVLSPQISAAFKTKSLGILKRKISLFYIAATLLSIVSFFIILSSAEILSGMLYNSNDPAMLIRILAIGLPFTALTILNVSILSAIGATDQILWISIWSVGLKTLLLVILTPFFGIQGSAWAINTTQIFQSLTSMAAIRKLLPKLGA